MTNKQPPADTIRIAKELESKLGMTIVPIRGRSNTFGWFFSTLSESDLGIRPYRWVLPQQEVKVTRAFKMVNGANCGYLLFDSSSNLKEDVIEIDGRNIVVTNIKTLEENAELAIFNAHVFYIKNKNATAKFSPEYVRRTEEMLKSLPMNRMNSHKAEDFPIENNQAESLSISQKVEPIGNTPMDDKNTLQIKERGIFIKKNELADVFKGADVMMKLDILKELFGELVSSPDTSYKDIEKFKDELPKMVHQRKWFLEHLEKLKFFETLINNEHTTEEELQKFLENNTWVFGEEYSGILDPKENIGTKNDVHKPDLVLKDITRKGDGVIFSPDLFELKKASTEFVKQDSRKKDEYAPRASVLDAIWQGLRYVEVRLRKGIYSKTFVVLGRHGGNREKQKVLKRLNFHLPNVQLVTYDELLNKARKRIKYYLAEDK